MTDRRRTRLQQVIIMIVGGIAAVVMVFLGLWQMQVFQTQGHDAVMNRTKEAPVPLAGLVTPGEEVTTDAYGRPVSFAGRYLADQQVLIPMADKPGEFRVLTALRRADGSVVPVVRGTTQGTTPPPVSAGIHDHNGVLLASEPEVPGEFPAGQMGSVRLSILAGLWSQPMIPGFVTLPPDLATAQGLAPAELILPQGEGSARNAGYALQWWVFAATAVGFCWYISHDLGKKQRRRDLVAAGLVKETEEP